MHLRLLKSCIQHLNSIIPLMLQCMAINPPFPWLPTLAFHFKNELNKISHHHDIIAGCNISPLTIHFLKWIVQDSHHHEHHAMAATSLHWLILISFLIQPPKHDLKKTTESCYSSNKLHHAWWMCFSRRVIVHCFILWLCELAVYSYWMRWCAPEK